MNEVTRRDVLMLLGAVTTVGCVPRASGEAVSIDLSGGREIGEAYLAAHPGVQPKALRAALLRRGLNADSVDRLRSLIATDFREGRVFVYKGWQLSETEGKLFAILTLDA